MRYRRTRIEGATYFFTVVTYNRRPLFRDPGLVVILEEAINRIRDRHPFEIEAHVTLPEHLHALWALPEGDANYSTRWRLIKEAVTRACASQTDERAGPIWQPRFWEHVIRDERDFVRHLDYIHLNPVHHGLVAKPSDWPYSTFLKWMARGVYDVEWGANEKPELPDWALKHE